MNKKLSITIGVLVVLVVAGFTYFYSVGMVPTDVKIVQVLEGNKENLLGIDGVVGAGIARDEENRIIGIAVYVAYNASNIREIPHKLDEFNVFIRRISEATEFEKGGMIIRNSYLLLLNVTTDKGIFPQNDNITITIRNKSNETVTFGNSVYDLFFEKWNGASWEFYTGVIGLEVITRLNPEEMAEVHHNLGGQTDKPFPAGEYRVISRGWLDHNEKAVYVWGYAEFTIK